MAKTRLVRTIDNRLDESPLLYDLKADLSTAALLQVTDGLVARLATLMRPLPVVRLSREERQSIGGILLPGFDSEIVDRVARGLLQRPDLFTDIDCDGADLLARQRVAERLGILRCLLRVLLGICDDLYLVVQGDALRRSLDVIEKVRVLAVHAPVAAVRHHHDRLSMLSPASSLLAELRRAIRARRGCGKPDRKKEAAKNRAQEKRVSKRLQLVQMLRGLR